MKFLSNATLALSALALSLACKPLPAPEGADSPSEETQSAPEEAPPSVESDAQAFDGSEELNPLAAVQKLAEKVAADWNGEAAAKDEVLLAVKFVIDGKSAVVIGGADGAVVKTGVDAVNQVPDVTNDLPLAVAEEIIGGSKSLADALKEGVMQSDNPDGFARFLEYMN